jgi:hypothetical protein
MSSIDPITFFPHPELTTIPADSVPDFSSLKTIHRQLNANALAVPSTRGGGLLGHLALVIPPAQYLAQPNAAAWINPANPGPLPAPVVGATAAQIAEASRVYKVILEEFKIYATMENNLKRLIIAAVPDTFIKTLKDDDFGYANVTTLDILNHLDTTYGTVSADDLEDNVNRMNAEWSPTQPIEDLWNQIEQCQRYAQPHDPITERAATRAAVQNLTNSGVFSDALKDWRKRTTAQQTWANLKLDFTTADKERRRQLTTAQAGFANKATQDKENQIPSKPPPPNVGAKTTVMGYCWSHGYGSNTNHTSSTCTNPQPGHRMEATVDNMLGGCCIIKRRTGERAVYKRPERKQPSSTQAEK